MEEQINKRIDDFFEKYNLAIPIGFGGFDSTPSEVIAEAFKCYIETGEDKLVEYKRLNSDLEILSGRNRYDEIERYKAVNRVLEYDGFWNVDYILKLYSYNREWLLSIKRELEYGPTYEEMKRRKQEIETKKEEERKIYLEQYYYYQPTVSKNEAMEYVKQVDLFDKEIADKVDVSRVVYPGILFLYDDGEVIHICKVDKELDRVLVKKKDTKNFTHYRYMHLKENIVKDVLSECILHFKPVDVASNQFSYTMSIYKTLNSIKKRYSYERGITLGTIKKVCEIYKIKMHYLNSTLTVINREEIDYYMSEYMGKDYTIKAWENAK